MKAHAFNFLPFWAWLTEEVVARERGTEILPHAYCFSDTLHLATSKEYVLADSPSFNDSESAANELFSSDSEFAAVCKISLISRSGSVGQDRGFCVLPTLECDRSWRTAA